MTQRKKLVLASVRGGSVTASLTFGENTYGFVDEGQADFMIGLEPLEAQRNLKYLHPGSRVVIDSNRMIPHSVSSQQASYPDTDGFISYLDEHINQVIYVSEQTPDITPIMRNLYVLGRASDLEGFPVPVECIQQAIEKMAKPALVEASREAFLSGVDFH